MKTYIQSGDVLDLTAPYDVASGAGFLVGGHIFAVAVAAALSGAAVEGKRTGVFDLTYGVAADVAVGAKLYWDNSGKTVTGTASSNKLIGTCVKAATSGDATIRIQLLPAA